MAKGRPVAQYSPKIDVLVSEVGPRDGLQSIVDWISAHGTKPFAYHLPIEIESPLVPETWTSRLL